MLTSFPPWSALADWELNNRVREIFQRYNLKCSPFTAPPGYFAAQPLLWLPPAPRHGLAVQREPQRAQQTAPLGGAGPHGSDELTVGSSAVPRVVERVTGSYQSIYVIQRHSWITAQNISIRNQRVSPAKAPRVARVSQGRD